MARWCSNRQAQTCAALALQSMKRSPHAGEEDSRLTTAGLLPAPVRFPARSAGARYTALERFSGPTCRRFVSGWLSRSLARKRRSDCSEFGTVLVRPQRSAPIHSLLSSPPLISLDPEIDLLDHGQGTLPWLENARLPRVSARQPSPGWSHCHHRLHHHARPSIGPACEPVYWLR